MCTFNAYVASESNSCEGEANASPTDVRGAASCSRGHRGETQVAGHALLDDF